MQLASIRFILALVWVSAVFVAGIASNVSSFLTWAVLAGVAVVPPLVMVQRWNDPSQTMSERIREVLR